ncbi:hypothetical protein BCV69DRAFT_33152 [Microstroma glucosiphilum]|uniref:RNA polymerase II subunit B1 CTD phosphatase RPAP2 homolog n=1 Tax=Pseudomicrostroma glucosiphilum TaxID=1684307 RepID=A0A316U3D2_9BASI|nr:hypothetical protein BCV69DRAFT_33152 [Pseudomicrostroma glucosiphilum]PWN19812.1 hypothetical protein BCV69DRAFT_33152 [Pseudomicrostroma glucosiphilum]
MPTAVPKPGGSQSPPEQAAHPTRLPTASSSLRVQLPPSSFLSAFGNNEASSTSQLSRSRPDQRARRSSGGSGTATPAAAGSSSSSSRPAGVPPPPQTSDASLLAQGILEQQRKAKEILTWQEKLMEDRQISREELKKGLTRLSIPYWLQILQERSIYNLCGYPTCRNRLSSSGPATTNPTPRFRISVSRRAIERDTSDEPGGRNNFCSATCHARSEWVRRWVLNPSSSVGDADSASARGRDPVLADPVAEQMRRIGQEQALQGGKWEALMSRREDQWSEIELLEDLEDQGELDGWEGFGSTSGATQPGALSKEEDKMHKSTPPTPTTAANTSTAAPKNTAASRLGPLTISERDPSSSASTSAASHPPASKDTPLPRRFHGSTSRARLSASAQAAATDEDLDSFFDLGSSAALKRSIQDVSSRLNATRLDSLPVATAGGGTGGVDGEEEGVDEEEEEEGEAVSGEEDEGMDEETRRARKDERRMLKEALQLRDEMRERGELD